MGGRGPEERRERECRCGVECARSFFLVIGGARAGGDRGRVAKARNDKKGERRRRRRRRHEIFPIAGEILIGWDTIVGGRFGISGGIKRESELASSATRELTVGGVTRRARKISPRTSPLSRCRRGGSGNWACKGLG
jgi:hypothetical protein